MSIEVTWFGHATMGLKVGGHKILVDPFFTDNPTASVKAEEVAADFILVSHGHGDHMGDTVAIAKRTGAMVISNFEIVNWLQGQGVANVHAQHLGGGFEHPFGYLKLTLALHGSALPDGSYGGNPCGFLLERDEGKVYFACDTGLFGDMKFIGEGGIGLACLPIGDNFTMGPADALRAVTLLAPKHVIPIHYGTWGVIVQNPKEWAETVEAETDALVHVLQPGESFAF